MQKVICGGEKKAQNLCNAMTKIFTNPTTKEDKIKAITNYNSAIGEKIYNINSSSDEAEINSVWTEINNLKNDVYTYYEYVQFKRAKFDCTNVEYNQQTGRIIKMEFKFNGKFE